MHLGVKKLDKQMFFVCFFFRIIQTLQQFYVEFNCANIEQSAWYCFHSTKKTNDVDFPIKKLLFCKAMWHVYTF